MAYSTVSSNLILRLHTKEKAIAILTKSRKPNKIKISTAGIYKSTFFFKNGGGRFDPCVKFWMIWFQGEKVSGLE